MNSVSSLSSGAGTRLVQHEKRMVGSSSLLSVVRRPATRQVAVEEAEKRKTCCYASAKSPAKAGSTFYARRETVQVTKVGNAYGGNPVARRHRRSKLVPENFHYHYVTGERNAEGLKNSGNYLSVKSKDEIRNR